MRNSTAWPNFVQIKNGWPSIDIGRMKHQITIEAYGDASPPRIGIGGTEQDWSPVYTDLQAAIEPVRGIDVIRGGLTTTQLYLKVGLWYQPGIFPKMRILHDNGSRYVIQSVEDILELGIVLSLNCLGIASNV